MERRALWTRPVLRGVAGGMSETVSNTQVAGPGRSPAALDGASGDREPLPWLLGQKIVVPEPVAGCLHRAELVERAMPTQRRLTVLQAPGGFGKTIVLAECCRRVREQGVATAWVSVDEQDEPAVLDTYIAYACQSATAGSISGLEGLANSDLGQLRDETEPRTLIAMRKIADLDGPFVLAFDELERLANPHSVALIDLLLERGPPNLHLAFACRDLPAGVNVAGAVLEGRGAILATEDLRFSRSEVAAFFEGTLSRERVSELMSESGGWPFALRISRNEMGSNRRNDTRASQQFVENWVESRLFAGLGAEDREFLLDIGLFEWIDAALVDEALERTDSMHRINSISLLVGMLEPVPDGATDVWRLHPLIREHCVRRRFRETPQRYRTIHRRIAGALERRGQTAAAMGHAVEADEAELAGEIMERAGGPRLFSREGLVQFRDAERRLSEGVIAARPRLGLARCLALILSGRMDEAKERYRSLAAFIGNLEDDAGDAALELAVDHCVVRGMIVLYGGEPLGSELFRRHLSEVARLAASSRIDALTRGIMEYSLCLAGSMTATFEAALDHAVRARECLRRSRWMTMFIDIHVGQIAMAQGQVKDAAAYYGSAERVARESYGAGSEPVAICGVLLRELAQECGRALPDAEPVGIPEVLATGSSPFQAYAAASGTALAIKLRDEGAESALASAEAMLGYVRGVRLPALARYVSALRVSLLAIAGRIVEAESAWTSDDLPERPADCLDLTGQSWREMEAVSCARLRLFIGSERFEEGRGFADELRALAAERGLRRTLMRALALSAVLEIRAGEAAASGHLESYLRLYAKTPYAGPLVREREDCRQALAALLEGVPDGADRETARLLLTAMDRADNPRHPVLSEREKEVLQRLASQRDKVIAAELGLSAYGVRYHIRKLFTKLGVRKRTEAVRRAREMGLIAVDF